MADLMPLDINQAIEMLNLTNASAAQALQQLMQQNGGTLTPEQIREFAMNYFNGADEAQNALNTTQNIGTTLNEFAEQLESAQMNLPSNALASVKPFNLLDKKAHVVKVAQAPFAPQEFADDLGDAPGNEQMEMMGDQIEDQLSNRFLDHSDLNRFLESTDYRTARQILIIPNDPSAEVIEDKLSDYYEHQLTPEEKLNVAEDIFNVMPSGMKAETDSSTMIPAQFQRVSASVKAAEEAIKRLAEEYAKKQKKQASKAFNLTDMKKQAQFKTIEDVIMWGPAETRIDPFTRMPVSDWHIIERNKGFGRDIGGVWNIDWEAVWRGNVMDKYSRPYRNTETGEWVGGYIQKRFETDKWIPPENNYQLLPGQKRKPRLPQYGSLESRLQDMRSKDAQGYAPTTDTSKPTNWTDSDFNTIVLANHKAFMKAYEQSEWKKVYAMLEEKNNVPKDDVQRRMMADVAYLRLVKFASNGSGIKVAESHKKKVG